MNQYSLPLFDQLSTDDTPVCQTEIETTHLLKTGDCFEGSGDCPTLLQYVQTNYKDIWRTDNKHRTDALRAVQWFSEYEDYGSLALDQIKRTHVKTFINHLIATRKRFGNSTANRYIAYLTKPLNHAVEEEVIEDEIRVKYKPVDSSRPRFFSYEEEVAIIEHLKDQCKYWMADMVILSCNSGMRKSEILAINDPKVRLIVDKDGRNRLYLPYHVCKTTDRYVPLNGKALDAYNRLKTGIENYTETKFRKAWDKMRFDVARGDEHFVFHVCRHTCASRLVNDHNISQKIVAKILGHDDERTTSRYIHASDNAAMDAVSQL